MSADSQLFGVSRKITILMLVLSWIIWTAITTFQIILWVILLSHQDYKPYKTILGIGLCFDVALMIWGIASNICLTVAVAKENTKTHFSLVAVYICYKITIFIIHVGTLMFLTTQLHMTFIAGLPIFLFNVFCITYFFRYFFYLKRKAIEESSRLGRTIRAIFDPDEASIDRGSRPSGNLEF
ncbi:hypothetical protein L596_009872 [Steinernema carpocapsae]|uniref:Uncharacterized protein n=1 Tax=Steinernema carpocapsae TaxID=34508 RepID=A0A4V6A6R0_STECR|nr:hypothetical protein L596_009872 [Steinernema carpocapsae]